MTQVLLTKLGGNHKIVKSDKMGKGYLTRILHLAPANLAGCGTVCPHSTAGCRAACLNTAGFGRYGRTQDARIKRTRLWFQDRETFKTQLMREIDNFARYCEKRGVKPAIRLNGTSDIAWERVWPELFTRFPNVQFYDYTKNGRRVGHTPQNYYLLYSRKDTEGWMELFPYVYSGFNVAVIFRGKLPRKWRGFRVIDGDRHDLRFLDKSGVIVGVTAKGRAKHDRTGFVV